MSVQQNKRSGLPLAYEIYSCDAIDWDNPPEIDEFLYSSEKILEILLEYCLDHYLLKFIVLTNHSIFTKLFLSYKDQPKILTDNRQIKQKIKYIIQKMVTNHVSALGIKGEITPFLKLFENANWVIDSITIEQVMADINFIMDSSISTALSGLVCDYLFFINHDGEPIFLIEHADYMQAMAKDHSITNYK